MVWWMRDFHRFSILFAVKVRWLIKLFCEKGLFEIGGKRREKKFGRDFPPEKQNLFFNFK